MVAAVLLLSSANLLPAALTERFSTVTDYFRIFDAAHVKVTDANFAIVERMAHWQAAFGMINARPVLGFGIGNYPAAYATFALAGWPEALGHAHNYYLNVTAETGLIGLAAYVFLLLAALWACWRTVQMAGAWREDYGRAIALGVLGALLAKMTHEVLDDLWVHGMGVQLAMLLAMVYAVGAGKAKRTLARTE
jgi:putative inorganic carbon (hco3(-)) transporter